MLGLTDKLKRGKRLSLGDEGTDADFDILMGDLAHFPGDIPADQDFVILKPISVALANRENECRDYLRYILENTGQDTKGFGIPISRGNGHWVYLRVLVKDGCIAQAHLIDSRNRVDEIAYEHVVDAIIDLPHADDIQVQVLARNVQNPKAHDNDAPFFKNLGTVNTCLDWVVHQAYSDLGIQNTLSLANDDLEIRQATTDKIYHHVLTEHLENNQADQVAFDELLAKKLQEAYSRDENIDESKECEKAFEYAASQAHLLAHSRQGFFKPPQTPQNTATPCRQDSVDEEINDFVIVSPVNSF